MVDSSMNRWVLLDFYIPSVSLAIELDGAQHWEQRQYDHGRSLWLARKGTKTVRFWNTDVMAGKAEQRVREMLALKV